MECHHGVNHGAHSDDGEKSGGDTTDTVTKVEQADSQAAQNHGEVQPREECSLVGEEDLGLDTGREGNALACRSRGLSVSVLGKGRNAAAENSSPPQLALVEDVTYPGQSGEEVG